MQAVGAASDASAPLENELREILTKLQQSFTQLIHPNASIVRRHNTHTIQRSAAQTHRCNSAAVDLPCVLSLMACLMRCDAQIGESYEDKNVVDEGESMIGVDTASTQLLGGIARFRPIAAALVWLVGAAERVTLRRMGVKP